MKLLLLLIGFILISCSAFYKGVNQSDIRKFNGAYQYIINLDTLQNDLVIVSDTIIHIERSAFFDILSKKAEFIGKETYLLDSLNKVDKSTHFTKYYFPVKRELKNVEKGGNWIVYFSKPYKNTLVAEVLNHRGYDQASYDRITMFNKSLLFLFKFNESNKIEKVYKTEIIYN